MHASLETHGAVLAMDVRDLVCVQGSAADDKFADYHPGVAFLFPGQGAQAVGMAKVQSCLHDMVCRHSAVEMAASFVSATHDTAPIMQDMCDEVPAAKQLFDRASEILGYDLLQMCIEGAQRI
jgi:[acyl-carrier-protein] S-malonyltransferase